jgi:hypothetical protein
MISFYHISVTLTQQCFIQVLKSLCVLIIPMKFIEAFPKNQ